jgi:hypothetical protein
MVVSGGDGERHHATTTMRERDIFLALTPLEHYASHQHHARALPSVGSWHNGGTLRASGESGKRPTRARRHGDAATSPVPRTP